MFSNVTIANLFAFMTWQSIPTTVYLFINYRLLKNMLAPDKISLRFYLATIVPIIVGAALYFSHDIDKAGKWVGLALLIYGIEYLALIAFLHAIFFSVIRKLLGETKHTWNQIGKVLSANGIAWLVAMLAMIMCFVALAAIAYFFNLV